MSLSMKEESDSRLDSAAQRGALRRKVSDVSLLRRLTRLNLMVLSVTMLASFLAIALLSWHLARERQIHAAQISAGMLANSLAPTMAFEDRAAAAAELSAFSRRTDLLEVQVFTPAGVLFADWIAAGTVPAAPAMPQRPLVREPVARLQSADFEVWVPVLLKGETVGAVRLRESMRGLQQLVLQFCGFALALILVTIAVASRVLVRVQRVALAPIIELAELADRVAREHDYGLRAVVRRQDEVGRLTQRFNAMLKRVEIGQQDLHQRLQQEQVAGLQMQELAHRDVLTQLPNRLYFQNALQRFVAQSVQSGELMALMFIDLDNFKCVNDGHGHEAGDRVLTEVALRMGAVLRSRDVLCRLGGDEFALLLPGLPDVESAELLAERLIAAVRAPLFVGGVLMPVGATLGLAFCPDDAAEAVDLLNRADQAMYEAKRAGKNTFRRAVQDAY